MSENNELPEGAGEIEALMPKENFEGRPHQQGHVYFVRAGEAIKIGFSTNTPSRIASLQTSNAEQLELLGSIPGTPEDERELHERFCHFRIRGEWFRDADEIVDYVHDKTWRRPRLPAPSPETLATIKDLINQRQAYGDKTPIGHRHSNLIEQIRNYEHAEGEQRANLSKFIARSVREIAELKRAIQQ